ncbi:MAG: T9SS type A sorting domain-containing protein [Crocinitomicaceae bacterium]|nr:T9SS type A sorting domain-containing protein [Crocinitomicaceae bacterium]
MKKGYILPSLALMSMGFFAFQNAGTSSIEKLKETHLFGAGGQAGLTGAPGEANCTQCHSGSTQDGSAENTFAIADGFTPVTSYTPGTTYNMTLVLNSNPAKKGFSAVVLDGTDSNAGSAAGNAIGGTQGFSSAGRDYISHTSTSNSNSTTFWAWEWTAPSAGTGDVTVYIASNVADDNGTTSGDVIYLSTHVVPESGNAGLNEEAADETGFKAGYNASENKVVMDFNYLSVGEMHFNLVDMNGRSVFTYNMGESEIGENNETIALPSEIKNGMYIVNFFVGNKAMSAKVLIQK